MKNRDCLILRTLNLTQIYVLLLLKQIVGFLRKKVLPEVHIEGFFKWKTQLSNE
jgi:hypothetical protein